MTDKHTLRRGFRYPLVPLFARRTLLVQVGDFQGMQHQVAQVATEIEAAS